jgi:biopolymer transport protein ExbD
METDPALEQVVVHATRREGHTQWVVNERSCASPAEVRQVLHAVAEVDRSLPVTLDVAGDVPLGDMIDVYDLCRLEAFDKIQFAVERQ